MANLLRFEFRKVLRSKMVYIFLAIIVSTVLFEGLLYFGLEALFGSDIDDVNDMVGTAIPLGYYFPKSIIAGTYASLAAAFVSIYACMENLQHTAKNIVAKGYNRLKLYFSKYIPSLIILIIYALVGILIAIGLGLLAWGPTSFANDDNLVVIILGQLLSVITLHAMLYSVSYTVGKMAPAIVINILVTSLVGSIFMIIDMALENQNLPFSISKLWITGAMQTFTGTTLDNEIAVSFVSLFIYLGLFEALGIIFARRKQF